MKAAIDHKNSQKSSLTRSAAEKKDRPLDTSYVTGPHSIQGPFFSFASTAIQPKLSINQPGDKYEQEADAMADTVMRMPQPDLIQRKCAHCQEEEEKKKLQRKESNQQSVSVNESLAGYIGGLKSGGKPLSKELRNFYEPRFGYDFSNVRIHDDATASQSAKSINALAYTHANNIVFSSGQYSPQTYAGKKLLGHELTHVVQQKAATSFNIIQRTPSREELVIFDAQADTIRNHSVYAGLPARSKRQIREIISIARTRDNWQYYLDNLLLLLNTPDAPATVEEAAVEASTGAPVQQSTREMNEAEVEDSLSAEHSRLFYPAGRNAINSEERQSTTPPRRWTRRRGEGGKIFYVDARDPGNIFVKIKVKLNSRNAQDIANVREMEDGIEKRAATFGYTVDLEFVNRNAADVFNVDVDLNQWTTSGNWSSGLNGLAHEMHHLMGLDDRYNYIDAHAANADMDMPDRIHWFREQMNKSPRANDADSIMNDSTNGTIQTDDLAAVTGVSEASIIAAQQARRQMINNARRKAAHRVSIAYLRINGTGRHFSRLEALEAVRGLIAPDIVNLEQIAEILQRMNSILMGGSIMVGPEIDSCAQWNAYVVGNRVPIHLCNNFFNISEEQQIRTMIHEAAHAVGIGEPESETYFPYYDCAYSTADNWNSADAWARYVHCISGQGPDEGEVVTTTP